MKHPVWDRVLMLLCALCALCGAGALIALLLGKLSLDAAVLMLSSIDLASFKVRVAVIAAAAVLILLGLLLLAAMLPARRKRSSNFAIQRNENGMVRISLKALETLVQKCLNQHAELKVVTSSLYSDEETIRVDVHIALQSDISMPLAISALQKQIKKYLEACSGVMVSEVRVFVDGTIPATEETAQSPYAIPQSLLGMTTEALPGAGAPAQEAAQPAAAEEPACDTPAEAEDAAAKAPAGESSPEAEPAAQDASSDAPENAGQDGEEGKQGEPV